MNKAKNSQVKEKYFSIATEFTRTPGPRLKEEGDYSAELFLETILADLFDKVVKNRQKLVIDLDGTEGYATSFLEGAFGGLARGFSPKLTLKHLELVSSRQPFLVDEIVEYIKNAQS